MSEDDTLLAHLIQKYTGRHEDAATDAIAYILNKSDEAMGALNDLLRNDGFGIEPIARVRTQVSYEDGKSRPDMTGEDKRGMTRLLVESKFGAPLLEGQASHYIKLLDEPAVLLFIAPQARIPTLWAEIRREMEASDLEDLASPPDVLRAKVSDADLHLMLLSWVRLLACIEDRAGDSSVGGDIRQLRGLVLQQDSEVFLPIHADDLSPSTGRRVGDYYRLVDSAFEKAKTEDWMAVYGVTSYPYGHGRYCDFGDGAGKCWFGVSHERWARDGDTPLWLKLVNAGEIGKRLNVPTRDQWIPIHPKQGVEYAEVLDDVVHQLKVISGIVRVPE